MVGVEVSCFGSLMFFYVSAALVDVGGGAGFCGPVEGRARSFHCHRANAGGALFFFAGTAHSCGTRLAFWRGVVLCGFPCPLCRAHPRRLCITTVPPGLYAVYVITYATTRI